jgi:predicted DNA-binding antitoxin AbrB/MazE fold protein
VEEIENEAWLIADLCPILCPILDALIVSRYACLAFLQKESPMPTPSPKVIEAVYQDGVFKPIRKVALPDQSRVCLTLVALPLSDPRERKLLVERQRKALLGVAGIGMSGHTDISENPHQALYGTRRGR